MSRARAIAFGLSFSVLACALAYAGARAFPSTEGLVVFAIASVCGALLGAWIALGDVLPDRGRVTVVPAPPPPAPPAPASAYRGAAPPSTAPEPRASARVPALVVLACALATSVVVPLAVDLPCWLEIESVLAAWWLVWAVVLTVLAVRGAPLANDRALVIALPWGRTLSFSAATKPAPRRRSRMLPTFGDVLGAAGDFDALVVALVVVAVLGVAYAGAWLVIEVAAPALLFVASLGVARALGPRRGARAVLTGAGWATAYVAPPACLVALVHLLA